MGEKLKLLETKEKVYSWAKCEINFATGVATANVPSTQS